MKRVMIVLLIVLLAPAAMVLANGQQQPAASTSAQQYTVTWVEPIEGPMDQNTQVQQYLAKKFPDIKLKLEPLQRLGPNGEQWQQTLAVQIAGGDIPDVMATLNNAQYVQYANQGVITPVSYDVIKKNAPKIFADINNYGVDVWLASNVRGVNYGIPSAGRFNSYPVTDGWRADWLKKLGLAVPTTIDEMTKAFQEMTFNDPNGDGKNDTYGMSGRGKDAMEFMWPNLFGAYGVMPIAWMKQPDGTVLYGVVTENMRNALRKAAEWYKMGVIDPEFITTDWAALKSKWFNGITGYIPLGTWYRLDSPSAELVVGLKDVNPNAEIAMAPPVKGPNGTYGYFGWGKATGGLSFGKQLGNQPEKLAKIIQFYETICTDTTIYQAIHWGTLGTTYKRDASGASVYIKPYDDMQNRGKFGFNFFPTQMQSMMDANLQSNINEVTKYAKMGNFRPEVQYTWLPNNFLTADDNKEIANSQSIWRQWWYNFIIGKKSLDTDWAQYVKAVNDAGLAQATADANKAWKNVSTVLANVKAQVEPGS